MKHSYRYHYRTDLKLLVSFCFLTVAVIMLPGRLAAEMVKESGPVESLTVAGYLLFCLFFVYFNWLKVIRTTWAPVIFVALLGLRELDFHTRFTTMGMFKSRFFISPEVPVIEKMIVILFILIFLCYGAFYLREAWPLWRRDLQNFQPYALSLASAGAAIVLSKFFDSNNEFFEPWLFMVNDPELTMRVVEECLELFIPILLIRSLLQYSWLMVERRGEG